MLSQLSKQQINPNLSTTTASARLNLRFFVDQPGGGPRTGPRQDKQEGLQLDQDWPDLTRLDGGGPMVRTVREDQD